MTQIDVLAIDDDKFIQKVISKSLSSDNMSVRLADDGESGITEATRVVPDIILLDVEMPGISGYEVCDRLRNIEATAKVPVVFLSSHSSLRERMQGYEAGGDDYLVKPFEKEYLLARITVLIAFQEEKKALREQYELAQKSAVIAMTGSNELGIAMRFMEKSLAYQNIHELAEGTLDVLNHLSLDCCIMIIEHEQCFWFSSASAISPLEKELVEMCDKEARFLDFGSRTIVNYPRTSLLVKNMPLDDMDRYGRIKDLIPILLSAVNSKIHTLGTQEALTKQSANLLDSFKMIRSNLYFLGKTIVNNRNSSAATMRKLVQDLNYDFLRMGLEEDQEEYLLTRIDSAIEEAMIEMDAGLEIRQALTYVLTSLNQVVDRQEALFDAFNASLATELEGQSDDMDDVELF